MSSSNFVASSTASEHMNLPPMPTRPSAFAILAHRGCRFGGLPRCRGASLCRLTIASHHRSGNPKDRLGWSLAQINLRGSGLTEKCRGRCIKNLGWPVVAAAGGGCRAPFLWAQACRQSSECGIFRRQHVLRRHFDTPICNRETARPWLPRPASTLGPALWALPDPVAHVASNWRTHLGWGNVLQVSVHSIDR